MDLPSTPQFGLNKRSAEASFPSHGSPHSSSSSLTHKHETLAPRVAKLGPQSRRSASTHDHPRALGKSLEVTFLNKVIQISLWSEAQRGSEQNERAGEEWAEEGNCEEITKVIDLAVTHFKIKLDFIESVHLVNIENSEIVWSDEDLSGDQAYYLCFARRGFKISQNTLANARHQDVALLDLEYFGRHGREFRVLDSTDYSEGRVQDIYINQSRGNFYGFYCPFLHCAKQFRKSCDLVLHFNIETGNKPYVCDNCGAEFRRSSAHRRHVASCEKQSEPCTSNLLEALKPSELEKQIAAQREARFEESPASAEQENKFQMLSHPFMDVMPLVIGQICTNQARLHEVLLGPQADYERYQGLQLDMCRQIMRTAYYLRKFKLSLL